MLWGGGKAATHRERQRRDEWGTQDPTWGSTLEFQNRLPPVQKSSDLYRAFA